MCHILGQLWPILLDRRGDQHVDIRVRHTRRRRVMSVSYRIQVDSSTCPPEHVPRSFARPLTRFAGQKCDLATRVTSSQRAQRINLSHSLSSLSQIHHVGALTDKTASTSASDAAVSDHGHIRAVADVVYVT